jgi:RNA polymerase sigma-70 factor (ECF subfamily)
VIKALELGDVGAVTRGEALVFPGRDAEACASGQGARSSAPGEAAEGYGADPARVRALVTEHFDFVWRSLLRLGVPRRDAEDTLQQVFLVASQKVRAIEPGRERAFLFGTALRLASRARRTHQRRREVLDGVPREPLDPAPGADDRLDEARARLAALAILDRMPLELRAVFVLFELEHMTMAEIAKMLELPPGTVASRLRRAREHFQASVRRLSARGRAT